MAMSYIYEEVLKLILRSIQYNMDSLFGMELGLMVAAAWSGQPMLFLIAVCPSLLSCLSVSAIAAHGISAPHEAMVAMAVLCTAIIVYCVLKSMWTKRIMGTSPTVVDVTREYKQQQHV
jgi:hypothetical protein